MSSSSSRPVTSKPRGICRYYNTPRGCFAGDKCKFFHGELLMDAKPEDPPMLTPYDKGKRCRYYAQGFCKKGDACWFLHTIDAKQPGGSLGSPVVDNEDEEACSICFERPTTYGLLGGCSHIFCTTCIKQWRDPLNKPGGVLDSGNTKKCPMCRTPSKFITPSSRFWRDGTPEKAAVTQAYKESMARVPCRYFQKSMLKNKDKPICPYGKDCFYQHLKEDGTPYIFKQGVDVCMRKYMSQRRGPPYEGHFMPFSLDLSSLDIVIPGHDLHFLPSSAVRLDSGARDDDIPNPGNAGYSARNRLRDVGRSLEMLNEAIGEGASTERLSFAVEALRAGLGRLEGINNAETRNQRRAAGGEPGYVEDDIMQRLEILAEQMMASINARQILINGEGDDEGLRFDTPPPPLEAAVDPDSEPSAVPAVQRRDNPWAGRYDSDDDSMPGLYSVSNTSEEDDDGDDSDDDDEGLPSEDVQLFAEWVAERQISAVAGVAEPLAAHGDPDDEPPPLETVSDDDVPALEAACDNDLAVPEADDDLPPLETIPAATTNADPPFVTDGRGRVVWSRPREEDRSESEEQATESGTGTGSGSASGSSGGTGRSFLDWLHALF